MSIKTNIKTVFFITLWAGMGAGILVLLVAAINKKNSRTCSGYDIQINSASSQFIGKKEIAILLTGNGTERIVGKTISLFDLRRMEDRIKKNVWISSAQLFFDNNAELRLRVTQREPIARIFTVGGNTFYLDSSGVQLPLSDKLSARVPVFTSFPSERLRSQGPDSSLIRQIRKLAWYVFKDPFWMAQIEQIDITTGKKFEIVPVVGNHLVEFGDGDDCEKKFHRLFVFYKEVMAKTGFDKYCRVDVQYSGQAIGTKKGTNGTKIDAGQAVRNIEQLIRSAQKLEVDTIHQQNVQPLERNTVTEQTLTNYDLVADKDDSNQTQPTVHPKTLKAARNPVKNSAPVKNKK
jgi:cell division protein FtsQ